MNRWKTKTVGKPLIKLFKELQKAKTVWGDILKLEIVTVDLFWMDMDTWYTLTVGTYYFWSPLREFQIQIQIQRFVGEGGFEHSNHLQKDELD